MTQWDLLPDLVLMHIFEFLPRKDRLACSYVCRRWLEALDNPILWKYLHIYVDLDLKETWTTILTQRYSRYIRNVELAWSKPYLPRQWIRDRLDLVAHNSCRYFMLLMGENVQLNSLRLTDWFFAWKFKKMTYHLSNFINTQAHLRSVSFYNANFSSSEILKLLSSCTRTCHKTMKYLDIRSAFQNWQNTFTFPQFIRSLERLQFLTVLKIDYQSFSNDILRALIKSNNCVLQYIDISVCDSDSREHAISEESWRCITHHCDQLRVCLRLSNICHYDEIFHLLVRGMPLYRFTMISGYIWDQSRSRNVRSTVQLLINNFRHSLVHVHLQLRNNREMLDDLILTMLEQCNLLHKLEYDGILRSLEVVRDICEMQSFSPNINFKSIFVEPKCLNQYNNILIYEILRDYGRKMEEQHVNLQIDKSTRILTLY